MRQTHIVQSNNIGDGTHSDGVVGAPVSMRAQKVSGASALGHNIIRCIIRACPPPCAQCYNQFQWSATQQSSPGSYTAVNVYCRHYSTANGRRCIDCTLHRSYILWGHCPPKQNSVGADAPLSPPFRRLWIAWAPITLECGISVNLSTDRLELLMTREQHHLKRKHVCWWCSSCVSNERIIISISMNMNRYIYIYMHK